MSQQAHSSIFMIKPVRFHFNEQTAVDNQFQKHVATTDAQQRALLEFNGLVDGLREAGVEVIVFDDIEAQKTPDSIFPNNWISMHKDGTIVLYPMCAENRRRERRRDIVDQLQMSHGFDVRKIVDFSPREQLRRYFEGTGSVVFDHVNRIGYAALSERTDEELCREIMAELGYEPVTFRAHDEQGRPIYHTNVLMSVAERFVVICWDVIKDPSERQRLAATFERTGHEVIAISGEQMNEFAGNILEVANALGESVVAMSTRAYQAFTPAQLNVMERSSKIVARPLDTIETLGGGGARCMMAEIGLARRS